MIIAATIISDADNHVGSVASSSKDKFKGKLDLEIANVKADVGIAVVDSLSGKSFLRNQNLSFPMQSVFKLPVSIAILRLVDQGKLSVQDKVTVKRSDVVTSYSPIKEAIKGERSDFTMRDLINRAICDSDNTACDVLIKQAGGVASVTQILKDAGIQGVRVDRPESILQPESLQIASFLKDKRDTSTPAGMVDLLQKLYSGNLLSRASKSIILEDLFNCKTGPNRLRMGVPKGWQLAHKTGTGADVLGQNTATNDVGIIVGPQGQVIYVAVFVKGSHAKIDVREALIAKIAAGAVSGELYPN
jgi:beta-lactamase class A